MPEDDSFGYYEYLYEDGNMLAGSGGFKEKCYDFEHHEDEPVWLTEGKRLLNVDIE